MINFTISIIFYSNLYKESHINTICLRKETTSTPQLDNCTSKFFLSILEENLDRLLLGSVHVTVLNTYCRTLYFIQIIKFKIGGSLEIIILTILIIILNKSKKKNEK